MRWTHRDKQPCVGDKVRVRKFLWFPKTLNGITRWLEEAEIEKTYLYCDDSSHLEVPVPGYIWVERWADVPNVNQHAVGDG